LNKNREIKNRSLFFKRKKLFYRKKSYKEKIIGAGKKF